MSTVYFQSTYQPDYAEMFAVAAASRRHHFSAGQRYVWWLPMLALFGLTMVLAYWGDAYIAEPLRPLVGDELAYWAPIAAMVLLGAGYIWLICYKLNIAVSARWLAQRKPPAATTLLVDAETIRWDSAEGGMWVRWDAIERLFLTPVAVCMLHGGMTYYVPRRLFADAAAETDFLAASLPRLSEAARRASLADPRVHAAAALAQAG